MVFGLPKKYLSCEWVAAQEAKGARQKAATESSGLEKENDMDTDADEDDEDNDNSNNDESSE
jgi:hypothetical protein